MYNILIIAEDKVLLTKIEKLNKKYNKSKYRFHLNSEFKCIIDCILNNPTNLVILPNINLIRELKYNSILAKIPILVWAPCGKPSTELYALDGGADGYFNQLSPWELLFSQINSLLRKSVFNNPEQIEHMQKYIFKPETLEVEYHGQCQKLSSKEYIILSTLAGNPDRIYSQQELNELTSGVGIFVSDRTVDTFVSGLRKKIGHNAIICCRNKGYRINKDFLLLPDLD